MDIMLATTRTQWHVASFVARVSDVSSSRVKGVPAARVLQENWRLMDLEKFLLTMKYSNCLDDMFLAGGTPLLAHHSYR